MEDGKSDLLTFILSRVEKGHRNLEARQALVSAMDVSLHAVFIPLFSSSDLSSVSDGAKTQQSAFSTSKYLHYTLSAAINTTGKHLV